MRPMSPGDIQKAILILVVIGIGLVHLLGCQNSHYYPQEEERVLIFLEQFEVKEEATFVAIHKKSGKEAVVTLPIGSVISVQAKEEQQPTRTTGAFTGKVAYRVGGK